VSKRREYGLPNECGHPEEPHECRGMCKRCYEKWYWATNERRRQKAKERNYYSYNKERYKVYAERRKAKWRAKSAEMVKPCPICGDVKRLVWDHDHETGQFRDYICGFCNSMLGYAKDTPERLRKAADYLEQHK
jgi:RNase P subunit RPR2